MSPPALAALSDRGLRLVVVSNANGRLKHLFDRVDLTKWFDHVLDSHEWGVEKPDPRLFQLALEQSRADASRTVHVGDLYHVDVMGARRAGLREGVLFDMAGLYDDVDCPRVTSLAGAGRVDRQAEREPDAEPRALTFGRRHPQRGAMAAHDAAHRRHAESAAGILRRVKRIEHPRHGVLVHAGAVVDHVDEDVAAGRDVCCRTSSSSSVARSSVSSPVSTVITPASSTASAALTIRFITTWRICVGSVSTSGSGPGCCRSACSGAPPTRPADRPFP